MSQLTKLRSATSLHDVANLLEYKPAGLSYLLYVKPDSTKYTSFSIEKRNGGTREICAPSEDLRLLQRKLADLLQNCVEELNLRADHGVEVSTDRISHGFKRKRSIVSNAYHHRNRRYVFNLDLNNFFDSINFGRVRGFFISNRGFQLDPKVATILAQIACFKNRLPQGSPCSPIISNLIGHILDIRLVKLAMREGCTYTRYADDLTFSTNKKLFPRSVAYRAEDKEHDWRVGPELNKIISKSGFSINFQKTRMQYRDSRQEVTGLIVNKKVNIKSEYRHTVRAMVHRLFTTGHFEFEIDKADEKGNITRVKTPGKTEQLHGMLGFVDAIDLFNRRIHHESRSKLSSKELMYRRFLMFKEFFTSEQPVIICEGKTDNVYITHAIRALAKNYPSLATTDSDGKIKIKVRRFRYTETSTGRILGIKGGTGDLKHFIKHYHEDASKFSAPGMQHPIIVLVDNDTGANPVFSVAKEVRKKKTDKNAPFNHVTKNLYLMATPNPAGKSESTIEDFFDDSVKNTRLGHKTLNTSNHFDSALHYGKADFAYKVIKPHADRIDFSGFKPLFDIFSDILQHHYKYFLS